MEVIMTKKPFGVLIIHGWTANPKNVAGIAPPLEALGLPCSIPTLRGHGAETPEAMGSVGWRDWLADAENALMTLAAQVDKVIIVGHSMGGMLALNLAAEHADIIDSIVVAGGTTLVVSPFGPERPYHILAPMITLIYKKWKLVPDYTDKELEKFNPTYTWVPTSAIAALFDFIKVTRRRLPEVKTPILIMHARHDSANSPEGVPILFESISTPADQKRIVWFEKTNHEMFLDCEREAVIQCVTAFVKERIGNAG
jgi:carboxylesterase